MRPFPSDGGWGNNIEMTSKVEVESLWIQEKEGPKYGEGGSNCRRMRNKGRRTTRKFEKVTSKYNTKYLLEKISNTL